jgi:hypothetical protein
VGVSQSSASLVDLTSVPSDDHFAPPTGGGAAFWVMFRGRILRHRVEYD